MTGVSIRRRSGRIGKECILGVRMGLIDNNRHCCYKALTYKATKANAEVYRHYWYFFYDRQKRIKKIALNL